MISTDDPDFGAIRQHAAQANSHFLCLAGRAAMTAYEICGMPHTICRLVLGIVLPSSKRNSGLMC